MSAENMKGRFDSSTRPIEPLSTIGQQRLGGVVIWYSLLCGFTLQFSSCASAMIGVKGAVASVVLQQ